MKREDFIFLNEIEVKGSVFLYEGLDYAEAIYESNIPYRPGVYLVYSINKDGEDENLLYYGKAGVTQNSGKPHLNFHQLPKRILATTKIPKSHPEYINKKELTRAKLWPWYVKERYKNGIKIYWYVTEWPNQNPITIENKIKSVLKEKFPKWQKSI